MDIQCYNNIQKKKFNKDKIVYSITQPIASEKNWAILVMRNDNDDDDDWIYDEG